MEFLKTCWNRCQDFAKEYLVKPFLQIDVWDVVDILLLAMLLYVLFRFAKTRRAGRVLAGLIVVMIGGVAVVLLKLPTLSFIVRLFASAFFFCVVLIFQPEIRDALERIGNSHFVAPRSDTLPKRQLPAARQITEETVDAVYRMADRHTGALIVFEGLTKLGDYIESGKIVDAMVTSHLLRTIFFENTPLHDGAVIIRDMRIYAASCVLPSTKSTMDFGGMGTRHRAAVGVTEVSDALVVIVSEQTGLVSVAQDGRLLRGLDRETLKDILMTYLAGKLYLRTKPQESRELFFERADQAAVPQETRPETETAPDGTVGESADENETEE